MMTKRFKLILISTIVGLLMAITIDSFFFITNDTERYSARIESAFQKTEKEVFDIISKKEMISEWIEMYSMKKGGNLTDELNELFDKPYTICAYAEGFDSLVIWSNNYALPDITDYTTNADLEYEVMVKLSNGYYYQIRRTHVVDEKVYMVYGLIPLKYDYDFGSKYLKNKWALEGVDIPNGVNIAKGPTGIAIENNGGDHAYYLQESSKIEDKAYVFWVVLFYAYAFIMLLVLFDEIGRYLLGKYGMKRAIMFLLGSFLLLRFSLVVTNFLDRFSSLTLFENTLSLFWSNSIGALMADIIMLLWLVLFCQRHLVLDFSAWKRPKRIAMMGLSYMAINIGILFVAKVLKSLVFSTATPLNFENIMQMDIANFSMILSIALMLITFFLFTHFFILVISKLDLGFRTRILGLLLACFITTPLVNMMGLNLPQLQLFLFNVMYIMFFDIFIEHEKSNFTWIVVWLVIFSAFSSVMVYKYNEDLEKTVRLEYAQALGVEEDQVLIEKIENFADDILGNERLRIALGRLYDSDSIASRVEQVAALGMDVQNYDYTSEFYFEDIYKVTDSLEQATGHSFDENKKVYFIKDDGANNDLHLLKIDIPLAAERFRDTLCMVYKFSKAESQKTSSVYTALFGENSSSRTENYDYEYALYFKEKLVYSTESNGHYQDFQPGSKLPDVGESLFIKDKAHKRTDLLYRASENRTVFVGLKMKDFSEIIQLFSHLFGVLVFVLIGLLFVNTILNILPNAHNINFTPSPSLRNRIQISVVAVIIISFIVIGIATVLYNKEEREEYHTKRLGRKSESIIGDTDYYVRLKSLTKDSTAAFQELVTEFREIHRMDVNVYGLDGKLIASSEDDVFSRGLLSQNIWGDAYMNLAVKGETEFREDEERVGELVYSAAYGRVNDVKGRPIAYLGMPYYDKQKKLQGDITDFVGTLLNVYVFLLLIAGAIAIFVANSITRPLTLISQRLREVKLGKGSQSIEWKTNDELGELVNEYNKMVVKLENSATLLAQSEREGAWREMAKQVAHEIKNPLTPMKLSIQYLQHAYSSNPENIAPMLKRVSNTLIEQIDNLAHIATEFSNFAKMPRAENTHFIVNKLVESVYDLFSEREDMDIKLLLIEEELYVYADKNQLMRVFNNLIKNSIQAIPDDRRGKIIVELEHEEESAVIKVTDNGSGIPDNLREYIFVPNFTTKNSGTGLGLAITKSIIESLDGTIAFETETNVGTTFIVRLPLSSPPDGYEE